MNIKKLGIKSDSDVQLILENVNAERMSNNPRIVTNEAIRDMINS